MFCIVHSAPLNHVMGQLHYVTAMGVSQQSCERIVTLA